MSGFPPTKEDIYQHVLRESARLVSLHQSRHCLTDLLEETELEIQQLESQPAVPENVVYMTPYDPCERLRKLFSRRRYLKHELRNYRTLNILIVGLLISFQDGIKDQFKSYLCCFDEEYKRLSMPLYPTSYP
jgi:hypothetical protein